MNRLLTLFAGALLALAVARAAELPADPPDAVTTAAVVAQAEALKLADNHKASAPLPDLANKPFATFVMENEFCDRDGKEIFHVVKRNDWQVVVAMSLPLGQKRGAAMQVQGTIDRAEAHVGSGVSQPTVFIRLADVKHAKPKAAGERRSATSFKTLTANDLEKLAALYRTLPAELRPALPLPLDYGFDKLEEKVDAVGKHDGRSRLTIKKALANWDLTVEVMTSDRDIRKGDVVRLPKGKIESLRFVLPTSNSGARLGDIRLTLQCDNVKRVSERKKAETMDDTFKRIRGETR